MSKNVIELNKIGSKVKLTDDVYGTIVEINIFGENTISYKCGWWNGRSYSAENFYPNEIEVMAPEIFKIGFTS